jgi:hypothetical protein
MPTPAGTTYSHLCYTLPTTILHLVGDLLDESLLLLPLLVLEAKRLVLEIAKTYSTLQLVEVPCKTQTLASMTFSFFFSTVFLFGASFLGGIFTRQQRAGCTTFLSNLTN